jgi:hypothetical protein
VGVEEAYLNAIDTQIGVAAVDYLGGAKRTDTADSKPHPTWSVWRSFQDRLSKTIPKCVHSIRSGYAYHHIRKSGFCDVGDSCYQQTQLDSVLCGVVKVPTVLRTE